MPSSVCVFCGSQYGADPVYRRVAAQLGEMLGAAGVRVIYGGGHVGLMGAVADSAMTAGGEVIGLIPSRLLEREVGHRTITELITTPDMFERKRQMTDRADAFVILPGGLGTLDELLDVVTLRQLGYHDKPIILVDIAGYWQPTIALFEQVVATGFAEPTASDLYTVVPSVQAAVDLLGH
jgi:uncharacterized protein (TIGR00730 family)